MKVIFIARRFPPSVGGMERFASDLFSSLNDKVEIVKYSWGGSNKMLPIILPYFFVRSLFALWFDRSIKVIHIQDAVQSPIGWVLSKLTSRPYIVVAHGLDITYQKFGYQKLVIPFVVRANAVISISSATKFEVDKRRGKVDTSYMIPLGMEDDYSNKRSDRKMLRKTFGEDIATKKLLLTTGRLVSRKGVYWFIDKVLPELIKNDKSILYVVVGDGQDRSRIEKLIHYKNLANNVRMLGRVSDEVRILLYQNSDVFVMPNIKVKNDMEGFGIVALEAATAGLPVVASNMEGIADAIKDGQNGILLSSKDKRAYVETITDLMQNSEKRKSIGTQARRFTLKEYSWDKIANLYLQIYNELVGD